MCVVLAAAKNFAYDKFLLSYNYSHGEFETIIELPMGEHEFKYLVDGKWVHDPNLVSSERNCGKLWLYLKSSSCQMTKLCTGYAPAIHCKTPTQLKMPQTSCNLPILPACSSLSKSCNKQPHNFATSL